MSLQTFFPPAPMPMTGSLKSYCLSMAVFAWDLCHGAVGFEARFDADLSDEVISPIEWEDSRKFYHTITMRSSMPYPETQT